MQNFEAQSETEQVAGAKYLLRSMNGPTISGMEGTYCAVIMELAIREDGR